MRLYARLLPALAFVATGCISSSIVLHVNANGTGKAVLTSRVYVSGIQAQDSMFPDSAPKAPPKAEELLPAPAAAVDRAFGTPVRLTSSSLDSAADGGIRRTDHEVFLEYEAPARRVPQPAQTVATQTPPDTEIYLAPLKIAGGMITIGEPQDITNNPGYDNQPSFTPDGRAILFTSIRGGGTQADIYRYDIVTAQTTQVTNTPESEYSPTVTPAGALSVVRVELDGQSTQRLWQFTIDGRNPKVLLPGVKPVGYHAWADDHTVVLFILGGNGAPATLQLADTRTGAAIPLATDIGRSIQPIPGSGASHTISFVQREHVGGKTSLVIKELDPVSRTITVLTPAVEGSTEADLAWAPDGTLLMADAGTLYSWRRGQSGWKTVTSLEQMGLPGVTRLAVSPQGSYLAIVASQPVTR